MAERVDPLAQYNFTIAIDGTDIAGFTEVSGLMTESDIIEYREGSEPATVRKLPGLIKHGNITLKTGKTINSALWDWRLTTLRGATERRNGAIQMMNEAREVVLSWTFINGWVSKYEAPTLNSTTSEVAIETIEITHEGLNLE